MSFTIDGIRIVDLPLLGSFTSDSSVVGEHLGSGLFTAGSLGNYFATSGQFVPAINPITGVPGILSFPGTDPYQSPDSYALTGSMTVRAQPYGYYDTGALLSLVATTWPISQSRAGINGGFENGVSTIASYGSLDTVNIYNGVGQYPPPLTLHSVTYDATHVYPQTPLTSAQMKVLRKNMYVLTNSVDTTVSTTPGIPNGTKPETHYGSFVTGWASDGTSVSVAGWTVPGSGHTAAGQVPSGTFDPGDISAIAWFGSPTNAFGANFVFLHHPGAGQDSRTRIYNGIEFDFLNYGTTNYEMSAACISINYNPVNGARLSADSYAIKADGFPTSIYAGYTDVGLNIAANTAQMKSWGFDVYVWSSPVPWAGSPTLNLTWESLNYIDTDYLRLQCWVSRDIAGSGASVASLHLGMRANGTPGLMTDGSPMAQLVWNPQGFQGGLQFQSASGATVLSLGDSGNVSLHAALVSAANDAAAAGAGVPVSGLYRNGSTLMMRVA